MSRHQTKDTAKAARRGVSPRPSERGYTLLALIVGMTISLIFMAAAMPSIKHQAQREREEEMFWRGQQVAVAISRYRQMHGGQWPMELDKLADNFVINGKKIRFLRTSALRDPMTAKGDWRPVRLGDPLISEFVLAYLTYTKQPQLTVREGTLVDAYNETLRRGNISGLQENQGGGSGPSGSSGITSEFGPIAGVVSKSKEHLIRNYYDIATYDQALIIQGVRMPGSFALLGFGVGNNANTLRPDPQNCPNGGIPLRDENGNILRSPDGKPLCSGYHQGDCPPPKRWINGVCQDPPH